MDEWMNVLMVHTRMDGWMSGWIDRFCVDE